MEAQEVALDHAHFPVDRYRWWTVRRLTDVQLALLRQTHVSRPAARTRIRHGWRLLLVRFGPGCGARQRKRAASLR